MAITNWTDKKGKRVRNRPFFCCCEHAQKVERKQGESLADIYVYEQLT